MPVAPAAISAPFADPNISNSIQSSAGKIHIFLKNATGAWNVNQTLTAENSKAFENGLSIIAKLTTGKVFVTGKPGSNIAVPKSDAIEVNQCEGVHAAGFVGTHIHPFIFAVNRYGFDSFAIHAFRLM
jgi:Na+-transporting NADH:ubiquinone oxidoreductase subunit NqrA